MRAVELGSTDIHLKVGQPPVCRIDGDLLPMPDAKPLDDAALAAVLDIIGRRAPEKIQHFHASGDLDIAYQDGDLPRFRVNAYRQRSATSFAFRVIPKTVPNFDQLHMPPGVKRLAEEHRGLILVTGATGSGKTTTLAAIIDYMNRNRKQHIITIEDPIEILHPDHGLHRQPARGRTRHRVVRPGAAARAPAGPRHDPDRRAARRRDRADRTAGSGVRPSRALDAAHDRRGRDRRPHDRVLPAGEAGGDPLDHGRRPPRRDQPAAAAQAGRRTRRSGRGDDHERAHCGSDP